MDLHTTMSRHDTAKVIFKASQKLLYPIETAFCALSNFHRYANEVGDLKIQKTNFVVLVSSFLFLAGKSTEQFRKISEVLLVVLRIGGYKFDISDQEKYKQVNDALIEQEQKILRALSFETNVDLPYAFILNIAKSMNFSCQTVQFAWGLVNELILFPESHGKLFTPVTMAVIVLYIAQQAFHDEPDLIDSECWWNTYQVSNENLVNLLLVIKELLVTGIAS